MSDQRLLVSVLATLRRDARGRDWRFPPPLEEIEDDDVEAWRAALAAVDHPVSHARLGDLLWERKARPDPHVAAGLACDGFLSVAADTRCGLWTESDVYRERLNLPARHEMPRGRTRSCRLCSRSRKRIFDRTRADLGSPSASWARFCPPARGPPAGVDDLLQRVAEKYGGDPYIVDSVADLRGQLVDDEGRRELRRDQVRRWREESAKGDGMLRVYRLEQALEIARNYGLKDEADELRRELSGIGPEELGLRALVRKSRFLTRKRIASSEIPGCARLAASAAAPRCSGAARRLS